MQGVCTQRHFPAVAQPFRVLWAPWSLAVLGVFCTFFIAGFCMIAFSMTVGGILLAFLMPINHLIAIVFGLRLRYLSTMVTSIDSRKTGSSNLSTEKDSFEYANI